MSDTSHVHWVLVWTLQWQAEGTGAAEDQTRQWGVG